MSRTITVGSRTMLVVSVVFILVGTNVFTYAATRYSTTRSVLMTAQKQVRQRLEKTNRLEGILRADRIFLTAITWAGGMYYGWNELLPVFGAGAFLTGSGVAVLAYLLQRKKAAGTRGDAAIVQ